MNKFAPESNQNLKVMKDEEGTGLYFDIFGTKIDVNKYAVGQAVFYEMQILYEKNKKFYVLFTRWGRLGDTWGGQYQRTPFQTLMEAKAEWCKIFRAKF